MQKKSLVERLSMFLNVTSSDWYKENKELRKVASEEDFTRAIRNAEIFIDYEHGTVNMALDNADINAVPEKNRDKFKDLCIKFFHRRLKDREKTYSLADEIFDEVMSNIVKEAFGE